MFKLLSKDGNIEKKYDEMDNRMNEMFEQQLQYVELNGTNQQKEAINLNKLK